VDTLIIPVFVGAMQALVDASCSISSPDSCSGQARQLLDLFDATTTTRSRPTSCGPTPIITGVLAPTWT
jgi:hypothetical protein